MKLHSLVRRQFLLAAACFGLPRAARAHDFHAGICDVQFNARSGNTEFVLSYPMHDFASVFWLLNGHHLDLEQAADEALLRRYLNRHFVLERPGPSQVTPALSWVGASNDADTLTVYQELPKTRPAAGTSLRCTLLLESFPDYRCTVNLRLGGTLRTLLFTRQAPVQRLW